MVKFICEQIEKLPSNIRYTGHTFSFSSFALAFMKWLPELITIVTGLLSITWFILNIYTWVINKRWIPEKQKDELKNKNTDD